MSEFLMLPWVRVLVSLVSALILMLTTGLILIYMLRKVLAHLHLRPGPNRVGPLGLLQTVADVFKLLSKEDFRPTQSDPGLFMLAPALIFVPSFMAFLPFAFSDTLRFSNLNTGLVFVLAMGAMVPIGILAAGWSSNSKWSLIGGMRAAGQQIAYEVPLLLSVVTPVMIAGSINMTDLVNAQGGSWMGFLPRWFFLPHIIAFVIFLIAGLAETNQTPFDMSEAESELIVGFANEYSGMRFALMFLAEFTNMFIISALGVTVFFGGWLLPWIATPAWLAPFVFMFKTYVGIFVMMWIRGTLPRIRIDQMLAFGWKFLIPVSLGWVVLFAIIMRTVRI
jgi:NADH-quinone oxidoreductase subunit H